MSHARIFGLDLLRCLAVVFVLLAHTLYYLGTSSILNYCATFFGVVGVEIFFVISGFLIGIILIKMHNQENKTKFSSIKFFWIRRWFRTLPNYYLMAIVYALLIFIVTKRFVFSDFSGISYIFFLQNFFSEMSNFYFGASWSLAVEEWFYLLFPLFLPLSQFLFKSKRTSFLMVIILFISLPFLIRVFLFSMGYNISWDMGFRKIVPLRLDAIGVGVLMAYFKWYFPQMWEERKKILFVFGIIFFIIGTVIHYRKVFLNIDFSKETQFRNVCFFPNTLLLPLISFAIAICLPFLNDIKIKNTSNYLYRFIMMISLISYSIYLSHPFYMACADHFLKDYNGGVKIAAIWGLTIIGSLAQYHLFEVKFTSLRDRFGKAKDRISL